MNSSHFLPLCLLLVCSFCVVAASAGLVCSPIPGTPANEPIGIGRGSNPGRVTWIYDPNCCSWDGKTDYWYNNTYVDQAVVDKMFSASLLRLVDAKDPKSAWQSFFSHFNLVTHGISRGYRTNETVVIKINLNTLFGTYDCNNGNGLSPQYLKSLLRQLVSVAGVPQENIYVYDASRWFSNCLWDGTTGIRREFPRVHVVDNKGQFGREQVQPDFSKHVLQFSNTKVPVFNTTYLPTIVTNADYMILVDNFRGHVLAGFTASGKNFFGSIYRPVPGVDCYDAGNWCPMSLHDFVDVRNSPMGSYNALVDLLGHPKLGANVMLYLVDGLYSGIDQDGTTPPNKFASSPFNGSWSSSVFASQDAIALDSVVFDVLLHEPTQVYAKTSFGCVDNYLHEAAAIPRPPSGTVYDPTGKAPLTKPLGVHEHWNNPVDKEYSRNLGKDEGIELVKVFV